MSATESEDVLCIKRTLAGDADAFGEIVQRYQPRVYALVLMTLNNESMAGDVLQDVFIRAYSQLNKFDQSRAFYPWLATIAVRLSINSGQRHARRNEVEAASDALSGTITSPDELLEDRQAGTDLWDQVAGLPRGEKMAVLLFYKQDMTVAEIAQVCNVSKGTVKTSLHRARKHLRAGIIGVDDF